LAQNIDSLSTLVIETELNMTSDMFGIKSHFAPSALDLILNFRSPGPNGPGSHIFAPLALMITMADFQQLPGLVL
jgi:hypothetical protein